MSEAPNGQMQGDIFTRLIAPRQNGNLLQMATIHAILTEVLDILDQDEDDDFFGEPELLPPALPVPNHQDPPRQ